MTTSQLEYICNILYETFEIPVFLLDKDKEILYETSSNFNSSPFYKSTYRIFLQPESIEKQFDFPIILTTKFNENFILLPIKTQNLFIGSIVVGPSLYGRLPGEQILGLLTDINPFVKKDLVLDYYQSLPILENVKQLNISRLLYYMVYQKELDTSLIIKQNNSLLNDIKIISHDLEVIERRQNNQFHHDYIAEKKLFQLIKEGRNERLTEFLSITNVGKFGTLSKKSYLRSTKNLAISGITLATRYALDGGLYSEVAFTLSDLYIQQIEELTSVEEIKKVLMKAFVDFSVRVRTQKKEDYSKAVSICHNYVMDHIYEPITLSHLSDLVGLHPNYLSALIKKEMGISFSEYLQKIKVDEAKQLLTLTNQPISEICSMLNYIDQSYFTKIFKKHTGLTPFQYRKNNGSNTGL